jgi:hypothetical protein
MNESNKTNLPLHALNTPSTMKIVWGLALLAIISSVFTAYKLSSYLYLLSSGVSVTGTIVRLDSHTETGSGASRSKTFYFPVYNYTYEGKTYQIADSVGTQRAGLAVGEKVALRIDPNNPELMSAGFPLMETGLGALIAGLLGYAAYSSYGKVKSKLRLLSGWGIQIRAHSVKVIQVDKEKFCLEAQGENPTDSRNYKFYSEAMMGGPTNKLGPKEIVVFLDPQDPKKYYMPLDFLSHS